MKPDWIRNLTSGSFAVLLHIVLIGLFVFNLAPSSEPKLVSPLKVDIVQARVLNEADILKEMQRQKKIEDTKRDQENKRQTKIDKKLEETQQELVRKEQEFIDQQERAKIENKKEQEEIKKLEKKRKIQEQKTREAEQKRKVAEEKKFEAQQQRRVAEEKRALAEADRIAEEQRKADAEKASKRAEEKKRKAEEAAKAEEKRKIDAERKAQLAEADRMLQESLQAEQQEQELRRIAGVVDQYSLIIKQRVKRYWIKTSTTEVGLEAMVKVSLLPSGDVKQVTIVQGSGNAVFDRSAETAVYKAAPLPMPSDPKAAAQFRHFQFKFKPE